MGRNEDKAIRNIAYMYIVMGFLSIVFPILYSKFNYNMDYNSGSAIIYLSCTLIASPIIIINFLTSLYAFKGNVKNVKIIASIITIFSIIILFYAIRSLFEHNHDVSLIIIDTFVALNLAVSIVTLVILRGDFDLRKHNFSPVPQPVYHCETCNNVLIFNPDNMQWYCDNCKK